MQERPTEYEICIHSHHTIYMNEVFNMSLKSEKGLNFPHFSQLTSSDLAKQQHDYRHVSRRDPGMLHPPRRYVPQAKYQP